MYIPEHFHEHDLERLDWLAAHDAFATLISVVDGAPFATHLPVLYRREEQRVALVGHWARANPQWQSIEGQRVLAILHGPHAYVSPRWYVEPTQNVPTWNYAAAHIYGQVRLLQDTEQLAGIVSRLAEKYESRAERPWRFADSNGRPLLRSIVGFELSADEIQLKFKLNQNHPEANVAGAISALSQQNTDDARDLARLMQEALSKRPARR